MKNRNLVPIFSVSGGVLFVMLYNVLLRMGFFVQSYNYTTAGFLGQAVDMMLRGFLVFVLGVYVGSVVPWLLLKKDNDFAPFVVTIGVIVGALVGFVLNSFLSMMTYRILPSLPMLFMVISWILVGLGAFWGGRFACAWETKKSSLFMHRIFIAIVGIIIFASPLILTVKRADFPGEKTSISVRHA